MAKGSILVSLRQHTVRPADGHYPQRLKRVPDHPAELHVRGRLVDRAISVAVVGARAASGHAMASARELAGELARAGALVVSGGAVGVDAAAHRGALEAGGVTVAVLGCGVDVVYPARNRPIFHDICTGGGALVSMFPAGASPRAGYFVRRNRIIAGLADMVILIEAGPASGALHTAAAARKYGRVVGALPGSPGCEALLAQGMAVVESAADVLAALEGAPRKLELLLPDPGSDGAAVLAALGPEAAASEDEIADNTGLAVRRVTRALSGLELEGLAVLLPGRCYTRSMLAHELMAR